MQYQRKTYQVEAMQLKFPMIMETQKGKVRAKAGDWLVIDQNGQQYFVAASDFEQWFEKNEVRDVTAGTFLLNVPLP